MGNEGSTLQEPQREGRNSTAAGKGKTSIGGYRTTDKAHGTDRGPRKAVARARGGRDGTDDYGDLGAYSAFASPLGPHDEQPQQHSPFHSGANQANSRRGRGGEGANGGDGDGRFLPDVVGGGGSHDPRVMDEYNYWSYQLPPVAQAAAVASAPSPPSITSSSSPWPPTNTVAVRPLDSESRRRSNSNSNTVTGGMTFPSVTPARTNNSSATDIITNNNNTSHSKVNAGRLRNGKRRGEKDDEDAGRFRRGAGPTPYSALDRPAQSTGGSHATSTTHKNGDGAAPPARLKGASPAKAPRNESEGLRNAAPYSMLVRRTPNTVGGSNKAKKSLKADAAAVDLPMFRENSEGLYGGGSYFQANIITDDDQDENSECGGGGGEDRHEGSLAPMRSQRGESSKVQYGSFSSMWGSFSAGLNDALAASHRVSRDTRPTGAAATASHSHPKEGGGDGGDGDHHSHDGSSDHARATAGTAHSSAAASLAGNSPLRRQHGLAPSKWKTVKDFGRKLADTRRAKRRLTARGVADGDKPQPPLHGEGSLDVAFSALPATRVRRDERPGSQHSNNDDDDDDEGRTLEATHVNGAAKVSAAPLALTMSILWDDNVSDHGDLLSREGSLEGAALLQGDPSSGDYGTGVPPTLLRTNSRNGRSRRRVDGSGNRYRRHNHSGSLSAQGDRAFMALPAVGETATTAGPQHTPQPPPWPSQHQQQQPSPGNSFPRQNLWAMNGAVAAAPAASPNAYQPHRNSRRMPMQHQPYRNGALPPPQPHRPPPQHQQQRQEMQSMPTVFSTGAGAPGTSPRSNSRSLGSLPPATTSPMAATHSNVGAGARPLPSRNDRKHMALSQKFPGTTILWPQPNLYGPPLPPQPKPHTESIFEYSLQVARRVQSPNWRALDEIDRAAAQRKRR